MNRSRIIQDGVAFRLRSERERLRLKQAELADLTGISRSTQISYEAEKSQPTTGYLQRFGQVGGDINFLLFGFKNRGELIEKCNSSESDAIDWKRMQECKEAVDFFFLRSRLDCPSRFRWKLIKKVYFEVAAANGTIQSSNSDILDLAAKLWDDYERWVND